VLRPVPQPLKGWKVLPHGKLTPIDENILTVVGDFPLPIGDIPRRMTVVRLTDGRLVIFSAVALDNREMEALEAHGAPAFLVVPNGYHRTDAKVWKDRYPQMQVVTPAGARRRVEKTVLVNTTSPDFGDPTVSFIAVPGTRQHEAALLVATPTGTTLVLNDLIGNIRDESGFTGWILRLMGLAGEQPQIPLSVKTIIVAEKSALRRQLLQWAEIQSLNRIVMSHGSIITEDPRGVLRRIAESLR
jgi:hypothetical protein